MIRYKTTVRASANCGFRYKTAVRASANYGSDIRPQFALVQTVVSDIRPDSGAHNDGFLPNALKRCFRLSGVLLKLCRLILGCAIKFLSVRFF